MLRKELQGFVCQDIFMLNAIASVINCSQNMSRSYDWILTGILYEVIRFPLEQSSDATMPTLLGLKPSYAWSLGGLDEMG